MYLNTQDTNLHAVFDTYPFENTVTFTRVQWVKSTLTKSSGTTWHECMWQDNVTVANWLIVEVIGAYYIRHGISHRGLSCHSFFCCQNDNYMSPFSLAKSSIESFTRWSLLYTANSFSLRLKMPYLKQWWFVYWRIYAPFGINDVLFYTRDITTLFHLKELLDK